MTVVGVISSPHEDGNSATLVREALGAAKAAGADVREVFLPRYRIEFCRACGTCLKSGTCPLRDDFHQVRVLLQEAEGVILSTPTYGAAPSARIKNLMDRLGQLAYLTSFFGGKYVAGITTASSFGHKGTAGQIMAAARGSVFQRARVSGALAVALHGHHVRDLPGALHKARRLGRRIAEDIRGLRGYPFQSIGSRMLNSLLMKPMLSQGIRKHREDGFQAVYADLVSRGLLRMEIGS
jgi:multimeric flavodoxin WrbA